MSTSSKDDDKRARRAGRKKVKVPGRDKSATRRGGADEKDRRRSGPVASSDRAARPGTSRRRRKRPILKFVCLFGLFMGLFYFGETRPFFTDTVLPPYTRANARISGAILGISYDDVMVHGDSISSQQAACSLSVRHGCDALLPTALFVSAALASPVLFWTKIPAIILGSLCILIMNLVRIVTLFYTRAHIPKYFERMHLEIWPAIFICLSIFLWVVWALWAREKTRLLRHATG